MAETVQTSDLRLGGAWAKSWSAHQLSSHSVWFSSVPEWYLTLGYDLFLPHAFRSVFTVILLFGDIQFEILRASLNKP